jgi:hypothetical protein
MSDALAIYAGFLYEINKWESAEAEVSDFNHFIGMSIEQWLKEELTAFELTQVVTDNLSPLIAKTENTPFFSWNPTNLTGIREKELPSDYRHAVSCLITLRQKIASNAYAINAKRNVLTKRLTGESWASIMDNRYFRPLVSDSEMRLYHRVTGNKVSILLDTPTYPNTSVVIESVDMEYIKQPVSIRIDDDLTIIDDTVFSESVNRKLATLSAKLFLENQNSQRLQNYASTHN